MEVAPSAWTVSTKPRHRFCYVTISETYLTESGTLRCPETLAISTDSREHHVVGDALVDRVETALHRRRPTFIEVVRKNCCRSMRLRNRFVFDANSNGNFLFDG